MRNLRDSITPIHGLIAFWLLVGFMAWIFFGSSRHESDRRESHAVAASLGVVTGPFAGALARPSESSCLKCAWILFPYCAGFLSVGFICQIIPLPFRRGASVLRIGVWTLGLLGWFGGSILSLIFAFS